MAKLVFFDEAHRYEVDGEEVPSVSELTRFISREVYGDIQQFTLDSAANRGSKVHKSLEILDKYGEAEIDADAEAYVQAYLQFRKDHKCTWNAIEKPICHPDKLYAGTLDRFGEVDYKTSIVDFKTCSVIDPQHREMYTAQLNLYRLALNEPVEALYILHLRKDGAYKLIPVPIEDDLANACLLLHTRLKKKKRKKKEFITDNG